MLERSTPSDTEAMTKAFLIDKGGICGQACLAVIEDSTIQAVLTQWKEFGMEFKGWSGWKQLREYLDRRGYCTYLPKGKGMDYCNDLNAFYILRIQWIGDKDNKEKPFYGWGHWTEASAHTHFIVVCGDRFFCNEDGWFKKDKIEEYLNNEAVITSVMEVNPQLGMESVYDALSKDCEVKK